MVWRRVCRQNCCSFTRSPRKPFTFKPKNSNQQAPDAPSYFPLVGYLLQAAYGLKTSLRKVRTLWYCRRIKERGAAGWSWWYPSGNRPLQQYLGFTPGAGYGQFEHKADSLIAKFKEAGGTVRGDWCMSEVTAIISALVIIIVTCHGLLIITVITPLPTKPSATKCQRTEAGERGNYWHADASAWCCCARCKIHRS